MTESAQNQEDDHVEPRSNLCGRAGPVRGATDDSGTGADGADGRTTHGVDPTAQRTRAAAFGCMVHRYGVWRERKSTPGVMGRKGPLPRRARARRTCATPLGGAGWNA